MELLAVPLGLLVGLAVGMLGGGGSVLAVPVLVYLLDQPPEAATTSSLVVVALGALAGGLGHHAEGRVCRPHALAFTASAIPGIAAGTALGDAVGGSALIGAFAVVMLAAAWATWRKAGADDAGAGRDRRRFDGGPAPCPPVRPWRELPMGAFVGLLTGFFGVGGGFVVVPVLVVAFAFTMRTAVGTSLAIITATSALGVAVHLLAGRSVDGGVTAAMAVGCVAGALAGAALAGHVPQRTLGRGFAVLVVAVAGYLIVSAAFLGGPPGSG